MRNCILCGEQTSGSIGAAGYKWSFICQSCKDSEDSYVETAIKYQAKVMDKIEGLLTSNLTRGK